MKKFGQLWKNMATWKGIFIEKTPRLSFKYNFDHVVWECPRVSTIFKMVKKNLSALLHIFVYVYAFFPFFLFLWFFVFFFFLGARSDEPEVLFRGLTSAVTLTGLYEAETLLSGRWSGFIFWYKVNTFPLYGLENGTLTPWVPCSQTPFWSSSSQFVQRC